MWISMRISRSIHLNCLLSLSSPALGASPISITNSRFIGHYWGLNIGSYGGSITGNLFANTQNQAIRIGSGTPYTITNNTFINNGLGIEFSGSAEIHNNNLIDNEAIKNAGAQNYTVDNNYWGTTDTTQIDQKIFDFNDNSLLGLVTYTPILTTPVTTAPAFLSNT